MSSTGTSGILSPLPQAEAGPLCANTPSAAFLGLGVLTQLCVPTIVPTR
jgi:hypothetical protein